MLKISVQEYYDEGNKMVMVDLGAGEVYIHGSLKENLDNLKKLVEMDWDGIIYIGGYEGDGKSYLAGQIAKYLDPTYALDRCVFTGEQLIKAIDDQKEFYKAIVWDEAQDNIDTNSARDPVAKILKSKFTRIRRKRLFIIICAPDYWRINRYFFIQRSRCFLLVYAKGFERGHFAFYTRAQKHMMYVKGKRDENPHVVKPEFRGDFSKWFPLDKDAYDDKKEQAELKIQIEKDGGDDRVSKSYDEGVRDGMIRIAEGLKRNRWLKIGADRYLAELIGLSSRRVQELCKEKREIDLLVANNGSSSAAGRDGKLITNAAENNLFREEGGVLEDSEE